MYAKITLEKKRKTLSGTDTRNMEIIELDHVPIQFPYNIYIINMCDINLGNLLGGTN